MFDIQNYASFVLAIVVFQLIPGAGTIAILNAMARDGAGAGMAAVLGTLVGDFVFMAAAAAGLAAVMAANPLIFRTLQWFGAAYLVWMGIRLISSSKVDAAALVHVARRSRWQYFRQALVVSLANPKVVLFFVSFFPLFLKPQAQAATIAVMMFHVTAISLLYQSGLVIVGGKVARRLSKVPSARKLASRLAGVALIGFGIKLAADNR